MNEDISQFNSRLDAMQAEIDALKFSNTIPYDVQKAFQGRGFLTTPTLMITGQAQLTVGGAAFIPMQGVSINAIAFATYADGTGSDVGAVMINDSVLFPKTIQLALSGMGTAIVYYIVFITANKTL